MTDNLRGSDRDIVRERERERERDSAEKAATPYIGGAASVLYLISTSFA